MSSIEWTPKALRQARKLPPLEQGNIADAVEALREWPNMEQVKALKGKTGYVWDVTGCCSPSMRAFRCLSA
ncbi:hypothetical protein LJC59_08440 [Desulfovibrio sp. OttesenSCG-928-A18]|nr:hypothetical protein [Desulfovibrio sp. OttesenSCG-928-A18]